MTPTEEKIETNNLRTLEAIGRYASVERFMRRANTTKSRRLYSSNLAAYLAWLREEKEVLLSPDELLKDHLESVFNSGPTEVVTKRKHTDFLDEYVNRYLVEKGQAEGTRSIVAAVLKTFYTVNDASLFGHFSVTRGRARTPPAALKASDIRKVLNALSVPLRTPLLFEWQSGIEIDRVLALRWPDLQRGLDSGENVIQIDLFGRKKHRQQYYTFIGRDTVEHLRILRQGHIEDPQSEYIFAGKRRDGKETLIGMQYLNVKLKETASKLYAQGLIENGNMESWHSHALRKSFKTESSNAGIKDEVSEFWMGHIGGIQRVYDKSSEVHRDEFLKFYRQVEPFVSLSAGEVQIREKYEETERKLLTKVLQLEKDYEDLKRELLSGRQTQRQSSQ